MAVPKRKISSHRQGRRRATHRLNLPRITVCPHCGADKKPNYLCPNCGQSGKEKAEIKEKPPVQKKDQKKKKERKGNG